VVIAFERTRVLEALDEPGSPNEKLLTNESHPTVWNQLEAAMAYARDVPMLTFIEPGLRRQGMLSDRIEWFAQETDLDPAFLKTEQFNQTFQDWLTRVAERRENPQKLDIDPSNIKVKELLSRLTPKQLWGLCTGLGGFLVAIATIAFKLGQHLH
jgi:hypothetical protein